MPEAPSLSSCLYSVVSYVRNGRVSPLAGCRVPEDQTHRDCTLALCCARKCRSLEGKYDMTTQLAEKTSGMHVEEKKTCRTAGKKTFCTFLAQIVCYQSPGRSCMPPSQHTTAEKKLVNRERGHRRVHRDGRSDHSTQHTRSTASSK